MPTINKNKKIMVKPTPYIHHNNISAQYYNTSQWHNLRDYYIKHNPLCERCLENGIVKPAQQVHHKIEFLSGRTDDERWRLLLDEDNLQSLCTKCHTEIHNERNKLKNNNKNNPPTPK
jgi:5-methylcytosine-specific restriction protein A